MKLVTYRDLYEEYFSWENSLSPEGWAAAKGVRLDDPVKCNCDPGLLRWCHVPNCDLMVATRIKWRIFLSR